MRSVVVILGLLLLAGPVSAQDHPPITDRDFGIDLYQGSVFGSGRIVGMGGASVAIAEGSAGIDSNPGAPATRPSTSTGTWSWDWHVDWLSPTVGSDFDNNGIEAERDSTIADSPLFTLGLVVQYKKWALGIAGTTNRRTVQLPGDEEAFGTLSAVRLQLARTFVDDMLSVGVGLRTGQFSFELNDPVERLFSIAGTSIEAGVIWRPKLFDLRVGGSVSLPFTGEQINESVCDPLSCSGYILPSRVVVPWRIATGVAWRFAKTAWNTQVKTTFRDERYVVVAADAWVTGSVPNGYGIEAFTRMQLQPSGRSVSHSFRLGSEFEWLPGRLRVRLGTYWEPGRFVDPMGRGIPGRLHGTLGVDVRIWAFQFWGEPYRVRLSVTGDGASKFGNGGVSIGFWH